MRYGIFSDIHANLEALTAVIDAYSQENIGTYYCLGDIVGYGADPEACVDRVKSFSLMALAGNHDWAVAGQINCSNFNPDARAAVQWTAQRIDPVRMGFLKGLRLVFTNSTRAETGFTLVHGTLDDPGAFNYLYGEAAAAATFAAMNTPLCFVGHTHDAGSFVQDPAGEIIYQTGGISSIEPGYRYIINVGSVGQPRDGDRRAAYCVFDSEKRKVEIKRVAYDAKKACDKIIHAGLPEFLGSRLLVGR